MTTRAMSESEMPGMGGTPTYFLMIAEELQDVLTKLSLVHENYVKDNSKNVESLARKIILAGHLLASAHVQGLSICNSTANIEHGERKLILLIIFLTNFYFLMKIYFLNACQN